MIFESAHVNYMEKIKEKYIRDKEEMNHIMGEANAYQKEAKERVYNVLVWHVRFVFKIRIPKLKVKLEKKFKDYDKERTKVELAISGLKNILEGSCQRSMSGGYFDANLLKRTLAEAFKEDNETVEDLKSMVKKARMNYEDELATIEVNIGQAFENQFFRLSNNLTTICKIQKI